MANRINYSAKWNEEASNFEVQISEKVGMKDICFIPEDKMPDFRSSCFDLADWSEVERLRNLIPEEAEDETPEQFEERIEAELLADAVNYAFGYPSYVSNISDLTRAVVLGFGWFKVTPKVPEEFGDIYNKACEIYRGWVKQEGEDMDISEVRQGLCEMFDHMISAVNPDWKGLKMSAKITKSFICSMYGTKAGTTGKKGFKVGTMNEKRLDIRRAYAKACESLLASVGFFKEAKEPKKIREY